MVENITSCGMVIKNGDTYSVDAHKSANAEIDGHMFMFHGPLLGGGAATCVYQTLVAGPITPESTDTAKDRFLAEV